MWLALLAETLGTALIVIFGCGAVCSSLTGAFSGIWQMAAAWSITVVLAILATDKLSGAHLNPAVTLAFLLVRPGKQAMTLAKAAKYALAQMLGGVLGGVVNLVVHGATIRAFERGNHIVRGAPESIKTAMAFGCYFPNPGFSVEWGAGPFCQADVSPLFACFVEAWGAFVILFIVFTVTHERNQALPKGQTTAVAMTIGATVAILIMLLAPLTQAGFNPARDFGPRLVSWAAGWGKVAIPGPRGGFWVHTLGPLLGAPLGAACAERLWRSSRS